MAAKLAGKRFGKIATKAAGWNPGKHPRDAKGRFVKGAGSSPAGTPEAPARRWPDAVQLRDTSDADLADLFAAISQQDALDEAALGRVVAEMDRREDPRTPLPTAKQAQDDARLDRLIADGWEFRDAYAEVHGISDDELRRQELRAALDVNRRSGETRERTVRRLYAEWVHLQYIAAEQATRGHVLTTQAQRAGVDPVSLFSGPAARARKWASEDLKRWWADNGRVTYTEFRADMLGRPSDQAAAERIRKRSNDRDFGL